MQYGYTDKIKLPFVDPSTKEARISKKRKGFFLSTVGIPTIVCDSQGIPSHPLPPPLIPSSELRHPICTRTSFFDTDRSRVSNTVTFLLVFLWEVERQKSGIQIAKTCVIFTITFSRENVFENAVKHVVVIWIPDFWSTLAKIRVKNVIVLRSNRVWPSF